VLPPLLAPPKNPPPPSRTAATPWCHAPQQQGTHCLNALGAVLRAAALLDGQAAVCGTAGQVLNGSIHALLAGALLLEGGGQVQDPVSCTCHSTYTKGSGIGNEASTRHNRRAGWCSLLQQGTLAGAQLPETPGLGHSPSNSSLVKSSFLTGQSAGQQGAQTQNHLNSPQVPL
jgi:hypothetical protein